MIDWILENTLVVSALALGLASLTRWLKTRPALLHVLWLVLLGRLIIPPIPTTGELSGELPGAGLAAAADRAGAALIALMSDRGATDAPDKAVLEAPLLIQLDENALDGKGFASKPTPSRSESFDPAVAAPGASLTIDAARPDLSNASSGSRGWRFTLFGLWALGSLFVLSRQTRSISRYQARIRSGASPSDELRRTVERVAARLDIRPPEIRCVQRLGSPVVWSFGHAVLAWPTKENGEELPCNAAIVAHELAHLRRRDHWTAWFELFAMCALWWNPVFWFVHRRLREQAELACDAWVVAVYPEQRRHYAASLIDAAEEQTLRPGSVPALGATDSNVSTFRRRLEMILRDPVSCRLSPAASAGVGLFILLVLPLRSVAGEGDELPSYAPNAALVSDLVRERVVQESLREEAMDAFADKEWEEAAELYRKLLELEPDNGAALHDLGYALLASGRPEAREEALEVFTRESALGHRVATSEYNIACSLALMGEPELALEHLHRSIHAGFDQPELLANDPDMVAIRDTEGFAELAAELDGIDLLRKKAMKTYGKGKTAILVELLSQLVDEVPNDGNTWRRLGDALLETEQYQKAANCFARQAELGHDSKNAWFQLGRLQAMGDRHDDAIESLGRAVEAGYQDYRALNVDRYLDDLRSEESFDELVSKTWKAEQIGREAWAAFDQGDWETAAEFYAELADQDPKDGATWRKLGQAAFRMGGYELALDAFEHQARLGHELEDALLDCACAHAQLGRADSAVAYIDQALALGYDDSNRLRRDPDLASLRDHGGFQLMAMRAADAGFLAEAGADSWEELAEMTEARLAADPTDGSACSQLGWTCLRLKEFERAAEAFALQDELGYAPTTARYNAACALSLAGSVEEAFSWLELAIEAGFTDESLLRTDLDIARLRADARFEKVLAMAREQASKKGAKVKSKDKYSKGEKSKDKSKWKDKSKKKAELDY